MTPKEKANNLYTKFQLYYWSEDDGYMPDDLNTKRIIYKLIDEIINELIELSNGEFTFIHKVEYWNEVKHEIEKL